uniref:Uncharacterized protein n=1 Tax=Phenylobacterium glaciei TaxID=2803784 RepID=A0A974P4D6_9CAUL|nr:hypothetical protein JKL49_07365 [Phenylobacterium glaciei]
MSEQPVLLDSLAMARFTARGFLRFDGVVPEEINSQFLAEVGEAADPQPGRKVMRAFGELLLQAEIPEVAAGARCRPPTRKAPPSAGCWTCRR